MIVVSDTSPVLNLARIGRLDLLKLLFGKLAIPPAVHSELLRTGVDLPSATWLTVVQPRDQNRLEEFERDLDPGEAEAIALALELRADLLLMDERRGRRHAAASGVRVTGLLGIVAKAKHAGLIDQAKPVLDDLVRVACFWIGAELYEEVLSELGER